jgi:hypothetical protein
MRLCERETTGTAFPRLVDSRLRLAGLNHRRVVMLLVYLRVAPGRVYT